MNTNDYGTIDSADSPKPDLALNARALISSLVKYEPWYPLHRVIWKNNEVLQEKQFLNVKTSSNVHCSSLKQMEE